MKNNFNKAFTLVELIVVITILAVLATVAFISFQGYTTQSRDTVRLTDMKSIIQALNLQVTQNKDLPEGENMVNVTASGTTIFYQGTLSQNQLSTVGVFNGGFDPLTGSGVVYARNAQKNKFQIGVFLEQQQTTGKMNQSQLYADNSDKYFQTRGDKIGILLEKDSQNPISTDIDLVTTTQELQSYISNDKVIEGTGSTLTRALPNANCSRLYENGETKNGIYEIYSSSQASAKREVYCDFSYPEYIISDELLLTGNFTNGQEINAESGSTGVRSIIQMQSPVENAYVMHQTGDGHSEYELRLPYKDECTPGKEVTMRLWVSKEIPNQNIFHHRMRELETLNQQFFQNSAFPTPQTLETKVIDGRTWLLQQIKGVVPMYLNRLDWYIGYDAQIPTSDVYFTGVRFGCE